ncbi:peptidoglycan DD-metalloendopeptidase family protein [Alkalihalobacillus sp. AL-G]|uniref:peptidoglycan DD-metalloendopeptidase family protein n=1 Tax=Alkalihalobacillus sp. AL-G TaxID=2926399 RepID=UPI00272C017E|nr:M23 family metallopeptidase [Alkalihalobacillus sp. AL-G]WLD93369.1 M23 family metallopeptidase [Alkalihalobacillus sp. AL-G]
MVLGKGIRKHQKLMQLKVRKITLLTTLLIALSLFGLNTSALASDDRFALIKTVYHVYVDGEDLGIIHDQKIVEQMKAEILKDAEDRFKDVHLTINEEIEYVPERIFRPEIDPQEMRNKLSDKLTVGVQAVKISVDGETLGFFKSKEEAEEVLRKLKLEYVDEKTLARLESKEENGKQNTEETVKADKKDKENSVDQEKVLDVSFSEPVEVELVNSTPDDLMTVKDAISLFKKGTLEEKKHEIKSGETLGEISKKYNLSLEELYELNPKLKNNDIIKPGQMLIVTAYEPVAKVIVKEKVKREETIDYKIEVKEDSSMPKGETEIEQNGKEGKKEVFYALTKVNGEVTEEKVLSEKVLSKPITEITIKGTKIIPNRGTGSFRRPISGGIITSRMGPRWGSYHKGVDFSGGSRSILAADNGTIVSAGWDDGGYGNRIVINHNNGFRTTYSHLSSISVSSGQTVQRGQTIGVMGSTGHSTGVHLHFEMYKNGSLVNPLNYTN